jgi:hypothetical protein
LWIEVLAGLKYEYPTSSVFKRCENLIEAPATNAIQYFLRYQRIIDPSRMLSNLDQAIEVVSPYVKAIKEDLAPIYVIKSLKSLLKKLPK